MRISHLVDSEIQAYLDRRRVVGSDLTRADEIHEHLERCRRCREELHSYEQLFGELAQTPEMPLPKNFAKKVTLSLPPLAAARTRGRIQASLAGLAVVLAVIGVVAAMNWKLLLTSAATSLTAGYVTALTWFHSVVSMIPVPDTSGLKTLIDFTTFEVMEEFLFRGDSTTNLFLFAALGIMLIASLEGLMPVRSHRQRTP